MRIKSLIMGALVTLSGETLSGESDKYFDRWRKFGPTKISPDKVSPDKVPFLAKIKFSHIQWLTLIGASMVGAEENCSKLSLLIDKMAFSGLTEVSIRPKEKISLFAKIRPGEIHISPTRRRILSTFYFFANRMIDLLILTINYFWPLHSFYISKQCTLHAAIGMGG